MIFIGAFIGVITTTIILLCMPYHKIDCHKSTMGGDWAFFLTFAVIQSIMITVSSCYLHKKLKKGLISLNERRKREAANKEKKVKPLFRIKHFFDKDKGGPKMN